VKSRPHGGVKVVVIEKEEGGNSIMVWFTRKITGILGDQDDDTKQLVALMVSIMFCVVFGALAYAYRAEDTGGGFFAVSVTSAAMLFAMVCAEVFIDYGEKEEGTP
jgi:hypothetical protein